MPVKRPFILFIAFTCIGLLALFGYLSKDCFAARIWHWRNGNSTVFNGYRFVVPANWLVQEHTPTTISLLDLNKAQKSKSGLTLRTSITAIKLPTNTKDIEFWKSWEEQRIRLVFGSSIEHHETRIGQEAVICLGGQELNPPGVAVLSMECRSTGSEIIFAGSRDGLLDFYAWLGNAQVAQ